MLLERAFYTWLKNGKHRRHSRVRVSAKHIVDLAFMWLIQLSKSHWRWVRRGARGERSSRPNNDRFSDNSDFNLGGQFRPLTDVDDWKKYGAGGSWLAK